MTRAHDMGGRFGDGPVLPDGEDAPVFSQEWHGRALAVTLAAGFRFRLTDNVDLGAAYEIPLTDEKEGLIDSRITIDATIRF